MCLANKAETTEREQNLKMQIEEEKKEGDYAAVEQTLKNASSDSLKVFKQQADEQFTYLTLHAIIKQLELSRKGYLARTCENSSKIENEH